MGKKNELVKSSRHKKVVAQAVGVNPKNIYREGKQDKVDLELKAQIEQVHTQHPAYGHKRLALELGINKKRIIRVMHKYDIKPPRRKRKNYLTRSTPHHRFTNLIKNQPPTQPNQVWSSDISYIKFQSQFWYLSTIIDIYTRQILGVQIGVKHDSQLVLTTLKQALANNDRTPQIFHTDQGTEFMAQAVIEYIQDKGIHVSVSDTGSPWQNGYQESFYGKFKDELGDLNRYQSVGEFMEAIYGHVYYYNHHRIHTALKMPPAKFAAEFFRKVSS